MCICVANHTLYVFSDKHLYRTEEICIFVYLLYETWSISICVFSAEMQKKVQKNREYHYFWIFTGYKTPGGAHMVNVMKQYQDDGINESISNDVELKFAYEFC